MKTLNNITLIIFVVLILFGSENINAQKDIFNQIRLAKIYESAGELEKSKNIYIELLKENPGDIAIFNDLNDILLKLKDYDFLIKLLIEKLKTEPENITLYGQLGTAYFLKGNQKKANEVWEKGISVNYENIVAYRTIANFMIENRAIENAIDVLKRGNNISKNPTFFSYDLANLYAITMKYKQATEVYCKILEHKPKQIGIIKNRILSYIHANGAKKPTLEVVNDFYEDNNGPQFLELLAELYLKTNEPEKAFEKYSLLENKTTQNGSKLFRFAQIVFRSGNPGIAAKAYKKIITDFPKSSLYSNAKIGYAKSLEADLISKNNNTQNNWKPLTIKGKINPGIFNEIISAYKELIIQYQNNDIAVEAKYRIAKIYFERLTDFKKAKNIFTEIISKGKNKNYVNLSYLELSKIAILENNQKLAIGYLEKISDKTHNTPELQSNANILLAKIEAWQGNFEKATATLNKITANPNDKNSNDALELLLLINTFKNDSTNLKKYFYADNLLMQNKFDEAANIYKELAENKNLFLLKDFAALNYARLLIALNKYKETAIFLQKILDCDEANIYEDKFLFLLGIDFYFGMKKINKGKIFLTKLLEKYPNSIYYNRARKILRK